MKFLLTLFTLLAVADVAAAATCTANTPHPDTAPCDCGTAAPVKQCQKGETCNPTGGTTSNGACTPAATNTNGGGGSGGAAAASQAPLRCQNKDGSLLTSATICEDKLATAICQAVFGGAAPGGTAAGGGTTPDVACKKTGSAEPADCNCLAADKGNPCKKGSTCDAAGTKCTPPATTGQATGGEKRSEKCDLADLADMALQCAKTCKICCETAEYGCENDASYGIDCQQQKSKCKVAQWTAVMGQACPLTCGLCNSGACKDNIQGCSSLKTLCRDFTYRSYMEQNCARTCKACQQNGGGVPPLPANDSPNCADTGYNCGTYTSWCQGTADQQKTMRTSCPKTCGLC